MKADLGLPWRKVRIMKRWLKACIVTFASEGKQRERIKTDLRNIDIRTEVIPFNFSLKRGGQEISTSWCD
uniref:Uncharacterized protein n=1 Tax=Amphimedon queenslandica TaxID=400682 RepID=A0A1X7VBY8_AMPQE